jgi:hypothetical protein
MSKLTMRKAMRFSRGFLKHLGLQPKSPGLKDFARLGSDASVVIASRTARGMTGTLSAAEAHRMVAEKQTAAVKAYGAFAKHAFKGDLSSATAAYFGVFRKAVSANKRRLRRGR